MVGVRDFGGGVGLSTDKFEQEFSSVQESENLGVSGDPISVPTQDIDLLEGLDSYFEDINDRLTISRMVSDSLIKGMVKAVEQLAEEKIAAKELEVASLKETMYFHRLGADKSEPLGSPLAYSGVRSEENGLYYSFSDAFVEHDMIKESLGSLRREASERVKKLEKEIDCLKGCNPMRRISSGSELVGLGGIIQEKASESLVGVDKTLDNLKTALDAICTQVDDMVHLTKASKSLVGVDKTLDNLKTTLDAICTQVDDMVHLTKDSLTEWGQQQEFQREVDAMVIRSSIESLHEEFEDKFWDQNARLCGSESENFLEKINEVSNLRKDLDVILKLLPNSETGQLISHGSHDIDHFHRKGLSNHVSLSSSLWEGNGVFEESQNGMPENWDAAQLKHMTTEDLVNYFKNIITEMRRNHESKVQVMTEEHFSLKREYFREKGSSVPLRKDKDLEALRKKIPEVILKLDDILLENEKLSSLSNNGETRDSLKERLHTLLIENQQLRDSLSNKRKEAKGLLSQVSDAAEKMLQHSFSEENLLKSKGNLESAVEDAKIEASITEEVYRCFLRDVIPQIGCDSDELEMQFIVIGEIYETLFRGAAKDAEANSKCEIGDSDVDSLAMEGLCEVIFRETIKDAESRFSDMKNMYLDERENRASLELKILEREEDLKVAIEEKEGLKQEFRLLEASLKEKEKLALERSDALVKEREKFQLVSQEISDLKDHTSYLQTLVTERSKELDLIKGELTEMLKQIEVDKVVINELNQKLELITKDLREANEHRDVLVAVTQEKQNDISRLEAKEYEQREQIQAMIGLLRGLSTTISDLECQVAEGIKKNKMRLEESSFQLSSLMQETRMLKRTTLLYKESLKRRCDDLQMAENEVDLLGDEVDALLSLLEKIYIALDHYSPILQHYPGIIEILKLVSRELSRESTKST
ncbi:hypothetical protein U1Q18_046423 [Sarracenia purpurea var. burkii]